MTSRFLSVTVSSLLLSSSAFCQDCASLFEKKVDKFKNETSFNVPGLNNVSFVKSISPKGTRYYLSLVNTGHTLNVREKGVTVLLSNGTKIVRAQEIIDVEPDLDHHFGPGDYEYSAFCAITPAEIARIAKVGITDFRLYIYDFTLTQEQKEITQERAGCLVSLK